MLVLTEIESMAKVHYAANTLLISGAYLEAAVMYEWISKKVVVPQAAWNELLARYLALQRTSRREVFMADQLISTAAYSPEYRSYTPEDEMDIEQLDYRCRAIIDLLTAFNYRQKQLQHMRSALDLLKDMRGCQGCEKDGKCVAHTKRIKELAKQYKASAQFETINMSSRVDKDAGARLFTASKQLDEIISKSGNNVIDLSIGRVEIDSRETEEETLVRMSYSRRRGRAVSRIDMILRPCEICPTSGIGRMGTVVVQSLGRIVVEAVYSTP
jgi:galactitol-specific phosphotransferase system IIB component